MQKRLDSRSRQLEAFVNRNLRVTDLQDPAGRLRTLDDLLNLAEETQQAPKLKENRRYTDKKGVDETSEALSKNTRAYLVLGFMEGSSLASRFHWLQHGL